MDCFNFALDREHIAKDLSGQIRKASWLGKHSLNSRGRMLAYKAKAGKISNGLTRFTEHFEVVSVERHQRFGILLLIRLADGFGAHVPLAELSDEARSHVQSIVASWLAQSANLLELRAAA